MRDQTPGENEWDSNPTIAHKDTRVWHGALRKGTTEVLKYVLMSLGYILEFHVRSFKHRTPQCAAISGEEPDRNKHEVLGIT